MMMNLVESFDGFESLNNTILSHKYISCYLKCLFENDKVKDEQ